MTRERGRTARATGEVSHVAGCTLPSLPLVAFLPGRSVASEGMVVGPLLKMDWCRAFVKSAATLPWTSIVTSYASRCWAMRFDGSVLCSLRSEAISGRGMNVSSLRSVSIDESGKRIKYCQRVRTDLENFMRHLVLGKSKK